TLYEPRGEFQLNVEAIRRAGLGALYEAFEKLKAKLAAEGLFDPATKKPIPRFPRTIGIVTSLAAAALSDVLSILRRRMPSIRVIVYPTPVQGEGAGQKIADAINLAAQRRECEVLILCRGGGSIEDLWAFNEEVIARAIRSSPVPIVSGVGHETDFTIADFAADVRAATPSAAAELVSPTAAELSGKLTAARERLLRSSHRFLQTRAQALDYLSRRLLPPAARLANERQRLGHLQDRLARGLNNGFLARASTLRELSRALRNLRPDLLRARQSCVRLHSRLGSGMRGYLQRLELRTNNLRLHLEHLSPQAVLERGYSIVRQDGGKVVRGADEIEIGAKLRITFARGSAVSSVTAKD
ncbi:MAG: exodeoxyribonuclease VII large subunit, partial [Burkholderiales bacterium]